MEFTSSNYAALNRWTKATDIASWAWDNGLTPEHLEYISDTDWARLSRIAVGRPSSDRTRRLVLSMMVTKTEWAAANPRHPDSTRGIRTPSQVAALVS